MYQLRYYESKIERMKEKVKKINKEREKERNKGIIKERKRKKNTHPLTPKS